jgi:hypothetical protein
MSKQTQEYILIGAALIGAYAAYLSIKEKKQQQAVSNWFTGGAFGNGTYDFYGQVN